MTRAKNPLGGTQGEEIEELARRVARADKIPIADARAKVRSELARLRSTPTLSRLPNPAATNEEGETFSEWLAKTRWPKHRPLSEAKTAWESGSCLALHPGSSERAQNPVPVEPPPGEKKSLAKLSAKQVVAAHENALLGMKRARGPEERDRWSKSACHAIWEADRRGIALDRTVRRETEDVVVVAGRRTVRVYEKDGATLIDQFDVDLGPLDEEMDLLLRVAQSTDTGAIVELHDGRTAKRSRVVRKNGRVGYARA